MKRFKMAAALLLSAVMLVSSPALTAYAADGDDDTTTETTLDGDGGYVRSELTNELIPASIQNQRPIAVMVDNEKTALPHYGVNKGDVVYEMMNSTANGRITRLMVLVKDWGNLTQFGSIRSARPTNFMLAYEWNAILVHDGGPCYINDYKTRPYNASLSAGFARFSNGKRTEFTEYVTSQGYKNPKTGKSYAGLISRVQSAGYSSTYNQYYQGQHFNFSDTEFTLDGQANVIPATKVELPFPHNSSKLNYNAATKTYDYYEYGSAHVDALDGKVTTFKNVILMDASFTQLDTHGYLVYNILASGQPGYYLTDGKAIPILWSKMNELSKTQYFNASTLQPLTLNTGKTYIAIVPADVWNQLVIK